MEDGLHQTSTLDHLDLASLGQVGGIHFVELMVELELDLLCQAAHRMLQSVPQLGKSVGQVALYVDSQHVVRSWLPHWCVAFVCFSLAYSAIPLHPVQQAKWHLDDLAHSPLDLEQPGLAKRSSCDATANALALLEASLAFQQELVQKFVLLVGAKPQLDHILDLQCQGIV